MSINVTILGSRQSGTSRFIGSEYPVLRLSCSLAASGSDCLDTSLAARRRFLMPKIDLTGQRFGRLLALAEDGRARLGAVMWSCVCDCGTPRRVDGRHLRNGSTVSCGCYARDNASALNAQRFLGKPKTDRADLEGLRFGRWLVTGGPTVGPGGHLLWPVRCECGITGQVRTGRLRRGESTSCGCFAREQTSIRSAAARGDKNNSWKGDAASYFAKHLRVRAVRGTPQHCEQCGATDPSLTYEWASLTHNYGDVNDYRRMCRSCHRKYDAIKSPSAAE